MKPIVLFIPFLLVSFIGTSQVVIVKTTKRQDFEHPSDVNTDYEMTKISSV
jgi:hypothetical protein